MATPVDVAYMAWLAEAELALQKNVALAQRYYDGDHDVPLTDRQKQYLGRLVGADGAWCENHCRTIVDAMAERLLIAGYTCPDDAGAEWAGALFGQRWMASVMHRVHVGALRDGEYFVIVWIDDAGQVRFAPQPRYADASVEGLGYGCKAHYADDDVDSDLLYVSKRWVETLADGYSTRSRMTLYYSDRVEKYYLASTNESGWLPIEDDGDAGWPVRWVDGAGRPLGIPVAHFKNMDVRSELVDAIPVQDALTKVTLDAIAAADATGFRVMFAKGFTPTTDGQPLKADLSNAPKLDPGSLMWSTNTEADLKAIEPGSIEALLALHDKLLLTLAQVTDTPVSRFQQSGQIAAENTLKQQESPLIAKVRDRQALFGAAWAAAMEMGRRVANAFGQAGLDDEASIEPVWAPAEPRDERNEMEMLRIKRELGVPLEQLWREMGYSEVEIEAMQGMDEVAVPSELARLNLDLQRTMAVGG